MVVVIYRELLRFGLQSFKLMHFVVLFNRLEIKKDGF